jgi:hypothetical protein
MKTKLSLYIAALAALVASPALRAAPPAPAVVEIVTFEPRPKVTREAMAVAVANLDAELRAQPGFRHARLLLIEQAAYILLLDWRSGDDLSRSEPARKSGPALRALDALRVVKSVEVTRADLVFPSPAPAVKN